MALIVREACTHNFGQNNAIILGTFGQENINQNIYITPVDTNVTNNSPLTIISFSVPRTVFVTDELIREVGTNKTVNNVTDPLTKVNHSMRIIKELSLEMDVSIENTI